MQDAAAHAAGQNPTDIVDALARKARKVHTPCGEGRMVWRTWGAGAPLILLHGGYGSWTHWLRNIAELSRHYELWLPDMPGLGDSAMPPKPWVPQSIADAIVAGIDEIFGPQKNVLLGGFSFGGHVAGLATVALQQRVPTLLLIGVAALGLRADPRAPFAKRSAGMAPAEQVAVFRQNLEVLMFADPANIDALAVHLQAENVTRGRFHSRPFAATDALAVALADIRAPLKTIWGTRDIIARPSLDTRLDILRRHHPELEIRLIEGAGHWVAYEAAEAFNAAVLDLLPPNA
jgi:pimeloyl-ACP methyl ester carboxylesterase